MSSVQSQLEEVAAAIKQAEINSVEELEAYRIEFIGSKGRVKALFANMKDVPNEDKRAYGQQVNAVKEAAEAKFNEFKNQLSSSNAEEPSHNMDLTAPGQPIPVGARHPLSLVRNEIISIFERIGFHVEDGPEIDDDWHNFTALNIPFDHPARDMQDTFFVQKDPDWVLRTHTSNTQIRTMESKEPPIRILAPGRVYRNETISARAHCLFHQIEGLYIDKDVSFADLKQDLLYFAQSLYGKDTKIRLRPSYFPFTEPSNCGIDPTVYSGYAFGMGIERITMLKYRIDDIRLFFENDIRFLEQFR